MTSHILPFLAWLSFAAGSTGYVVFAKLAGRAERQGPRSGDGLLGPSWAGGTTPEGRKYRRKAFMSLGFGMLVALLFGALAVLQVSLRS